MSSQYIGPSAGTQRSNTDRFVFVSHAFLERPPIVRKSAEGFLTNRQHNFGLTLQVAAREAHESDKTLRAYRLTEINIILPIVAETDERNRSIKSFNKPGNKYDYRKTDHRIRKAARDGYKRIRWELDNHEPASFAVVITKYHLCRLASYDTTIKRSDFERDLHYLSQPTRAARKFDPVISHWERLPDGTYRITVRYDVWQSPAWAYKFYPPFPTIKSAPVLRLVLYIIGLGDQTKPSYKQKNGVHPEWLKQHIGIYARNDREFSDALDNTLRQANEILGTKACQIRETKDGKIRFRRIKMSKKRIRVQKIKDHELDYFEKVNEAHQRKNRREQPDDLDQVAERFKPAMDRAEEEEQRYFAREQRKAKKRADPHVPEIKRWLSNPTHHKKPSDEVLDDYETAYEFESHRVRTARIMHSGVISRK